MTKNVRLGRGEIDIVATKGEVIAFIEIKASVSLRFGLPQERVTRDKQKQLKKLANMYLKNNPGYATEFDPRFDVVSIISHNYDDQSTFVIEHFEDAFR